MPIQARCISAPVWFRRATGRDELQLDDVLAGTQRSAAQGAQFLLQVVDPLAQV